MNEKVIPTLDIFEVPILERKDQGSKRHYITRDDEGNITGKAPSVTSITRVMPPNPFLEKWKFSFNGQIEYKRSLDTMAYYGTMLHIVFGDLVQGLPVMLGEKDIEKMFNLNSVPKEDGGLPEYSHVKLPATVNDTQYNAKRYRKDVIAIYQFVQDWIVRDKVRVVGIELPLADFNHCFAGCIDLVLEVDKGKVINAGTPKEEWKPDLHYVIFDLKSGSGHYLSHEVQLNAYQRLLCKQLDIKSEKITMFNLHMKSWTEKTYIKYLNGTSKTTPYDLKKVAYDELWEHTLQTYWYYNDPIVITEEKEIDYNTTLDQIIKQMLGEENAEADADKNKQK